MIIEGITSCKEWWEKPTNLIAIEFGVVSLSFTIIHNIFMLYYTDLFIFQYGLSFGWLLVSQCLFVVWNTVSKYLLGDDPKHIDKDKFRYETVVNYGGPALSVVFLLSFLVQVSSSYSTPASGSGGVSSIFLGIYFSLFLCLYDTLFNRVLLSRQIWLQENVPNVKDKLKIHLLGFVFGSVASFSVLPSHIYYTAGITPFRWFCVVISLISFTGFTISSFFHITLEPTKKQPKNYNTASTSLKYPTSPPSPLPHVNIISVSGNITQPNIEWTATHNINITPHNNYRSLSKSSIKSSDDNIEKENTKSSDNNNNSSSSSINNKTNNKNKNTNNINNNNSSFGWTLIRNTLTHKNMLICVFTNFLQVFSSTFSLIFMEIFLSQLLQHVAVWFRAVVLFVSFFSPVVLSVVLSPMASKRDVYDILRGLFIVKVGISVLALLCGRLVFIVSVFMIFSRAVVESVFGLWVYVNQDVDDEYYVKYGKRKASSSFFFMNKIGQAAAPVIGWLVFVTIPTSTTIVFDTTNTSTPATSRVLTVSGSSSVVDDATLFYWMVLVMLTSGSLQLLVWSQYSLRGSYLKDIKMMASSSFTSSPQVGSSRNAYIRSSRW